MVCVCVCVCVCRLESVRDTAPKTSSGMEQNQDFLETACLYVIAQSELWTHSNIAAWLLTKEMVETTIGV